MLNIEDLIASKLEFAQLKAEGKIQGARAKTNRSTIIPDNACCGNCQNASYAGIMEVKMEFSTCEEYKLSERFVNRPSSEACPFWRARSVARMQAERIFSNQMISAISGLNSTFKARSPVGKVSLPKRPKELNVNRAKDALALLGIGLQDPNFLIDDEDENGGDDE